MKSKAILAYQYGMANAGDFAITLGAIDFLLKYYENVVVISKYTSNHACYKQAADYFSVIYDTRVVLVPGPFDLDRSSRLNLCISYVKGLFSSISLKTKKKYSKVFSNADDVFINGGNLLRCESLNDYIRLIALLYPAKIALLNHLRLIFLPQSTTKINKIGHRYLYRYLSYSKAVISRERLSYQYLKRSFPDINLLNFIDMAFFIDNRRTITDRSSVKYPWLYRMGDKPIALTLRKERIGDIGELSLDQMSVISREIHFLIDYVLSSNESLVFVIQTEKDRDFTYQMYNYAVMRSISDSVYIIEEHDPLILREIYSNVSVLIGMRLHSIILASSMLTPVVGYFDKEWGLKNPGVMNEINMPFTYIGDNPEWRDEINRAKLSNKLVEVKESYTEQFDSFMLNN